MDVYKKYNVVFFQKIHTRKQIEYDTYIYTNRLMDSVHLPSNKSDCGCELARAALQKTLQIVLKDT